MTFLFSYKKEVFVHFAERAGYTKVNPSDRIVKCLIYEFDVALMIFFGFLNHSYSDVTGSFIQKQAKTENGVL